MSYAAYLTNTRDGANKHYYIAVWAREDGQWVVGCAWGARTALYQQEKIYEGGKSGPVFPAEQVATKYAEAIVNNKCREGYNLEWDAKTLTFSWEHIRDHKHAEKYAPQWFNDVRTGQVPTSSNPASTSQRIQRLKDQEAGDELSLDPSKINTSGKKPSFDELKSRFGSASKRTAKKEEEVPFGFKPRFAKR